MTNDTDRLARMERRQEALITAIGNLAQVCAMTNQLVVQLIEWMQKEPEGPRQIEIILEIVDMVREVQDKLEALPAETAAALAAHVP